MNSYSLLKTIVLLLIATCNTLYSSAAQLPDGFVEERIATNLDPTAMRIASDGRLFITEKNGTVRIIENGILLDDPFITFDVDNFNERGLGGLVFHPNFEQNGYVYFYYTHPEENRNVITRVTANGNFAIPGSEEIIFRIDQLNGTIHMGGDMHFGPDGKLYISVGDGTNGVAPSKYNSLLGKMLRINDDGSIPNDNPFLDITDGDNGAIWALGLRNSYSTAMHPETGQLFGCDVGSTDYEEVNDITRGGYYGWPELEGNRTNQFLPDNYQDPFYQYGHELGCAVIGATFYAPETKTFPEEYHDKFFFADYCKGYIKVLNPETAQIEETFATQIDRPISLLVSDAGDMYYIERSGMGGGSMEDNTSTTNGSIWKISYSGTGAPFLAIQPDDKFLPAGENAHFEVKVFGDDPLTYQWYRDGNIILDATQADYTIFDVSLSDHNTSYYCKIANIFGNIQSRSALLEVTANTRPSTTIIAPIDGSIYQAGDTIIFDGIALDAEDGALEDFSKSWFIDFHHDDHTHPALEDYSGFDSGTFVIPRLGEVDDNVWYRIHLNATDSEGLSHSSFVDIYPEKISFNVTTLPVGLNVSIDGQSRTSPVDVLSVAGIERTLAAPEFQVRGDTVYRFERWNDSDNANRFYNFQAGNENEHVAIYQEVPFFIGDGTGLTADIFNGINQEDLNSGLPVYTKIDPTVDFDFKLSGPIPDVGDDQFMIRWRGDLLAPATGDFDFFITSDDGVRLWIDDKIIIDQWVNQAASLSKGTKSLEGGKRYKIRLEYFEDGGASSVRLEYASQVIPKVIVPTSQLYPDPLTDQSIDFLTKVYPSPVINDAIIELSTWRKMDIRWTVYDISGRRCFGDSLTLDAGTTKVNMNMSYLSSGLYYLIINSERGVSTILTLLKQ